MIAFNGYLTSVGTASDVCGIRNTVMAAGQGLVLTPKTPWRVWRPDTTWSAKFWPGIRMRWERASAVARTTVDSLACRTTVRHRPVDRVQYVSDGFWTCIDDAKLTESEVDCDGQRTTGYLTENACRDCDGSNGHGRVNFSDWHPDDVLDEAAVDGYVCRTTAYLNERGLDGQ